MNQQQKMKDDLIKEILVYWDHFIYAKDLLSVRDHLLSINRDKDLNQLAPNFFKIASAGMVESVYIVLSRLLDSDKNAKSIQNFIKKCEINLTLFPNKEQTQCKIDEYNQKIKFDEYISKGIKVLEHRRDKVYAHNDKTYFAHPEKTPYLPSYELWFLTDFIGEVIKCFLDFFSIPTPIEPCYDKDLDKLFPRS